jgi:hypothetical protein
MKALLKDLNAQTPMCAKNERSYIMAYVSIPKDLNAVKSRIILGLNKRQAVCFGAAALTGVPLFFLLKGIIPTNLTAILMVIVMMPWFMFAMFEKNGQPLEVYLRYIVAVKYTKPQKRIYQTGNIYAALERQAKLYGEVHRIVNNK